MGNFEHAAMLVADLNKLITVVMGVYGLVTPMLYCKSLASMIQMPGYSCFFQQSEVLHLSKVKQSIQTQGLRLSCPVKDRWTGLSLTPGVMHQAGSLFKWQG